MRIRDSHPILLYILTASSLGPGLGGCDVERAANTAVVSDSAGIRLVELGAPPELDGSLGFVEEPVLRIPRTETDRPFEDVIAGALLADGQFAVLDGGRTQEVVVVDASGEVVQVLGGVGGGPGEFQDAVALARIGEDTVVVQDRGNGRTSFFHRGELVDETTFDPAWDLYALGTDEDGRMVVGMPPAEVRGFRHPEPWLDVPLVRIDLQAWSADTIARADWYESILFEGNNPFRSEGSVALSGERIVVGRGDRAELTWIGLDGEPRQIVRWDGVPREVTAELWTEYAEGTEAWFRSYGVPNITERLQSLQEAASDVLPLFEDVRTDLDGNVWLTEYAIPEELPPGILVISETGEWLGRLSNPGMLDVLDVGWDRVLGVEEDDLGVTAVVVYELRRADP